MSVRKETGRIPSHLGGSVKAAILLLAMSRPLARKLIATFSDDQIRLMVSTVSGLREVEDELVLPLIEELARSVGHGASLVMGSIETARELLEGVVPESELEDLAQGGRSAQGANEWREIMDASIEDLFDFSLSENPQVLACILSRVDTEKAGRVLQRLDVERRTDILTRMFQLKPVSDEAMRLVRDDLIGRMRKSGSEKAATVDPSRVGAMLNAMDKQPMEETVRALSTSRPVEAQSVKHYLFSFEDIANLSSVDRRQLLDRVSVDEIAIALSDKSPEFQALVYSALSPRSRRIVEAGIEGAAGRPGALVERARRSIIRAALEMAERGVIKIGEASQI